MNSGSRSRREERREYRERLGAAHILDAAEEVFAEHGFVGTTVRRISERAEFSVGALYKLFPGGKEHVFEAVVERRSRQFLADLDATLTAGGDAVERLHRIVDVTVRFFTEHDVFFRVYHRASGGDQLNWRYYGEIVDRYAEVLREGQRDGTIVADTDAGALALMLSAVQTMYLSHTVVGLGPPPIPMTCLHGLVDRAFVTSP